MTRGGSINSLWHPRRLAEHSAGVSDHRGSNSQLIDFEEVEIYPVFTAKIENTEKWVLGSDGTRNRCKPAITVAELLLSAKKGR